MWVEGGLLAPENTRMDNMGVNTQSCSEEDSDSDSEETEISEIRKMIGLQNLE